MTLIQRVKSLQPLRQKRICAVWIVTLLFCVLCIVKILLPNRVYTFACDRQVSLDHSQEVLVSNIILPPGVYQVELSYETAQDAKSLVNVSDGTVYPGGLLCNGEMLYSQLGKTGFHLWLFETSGQMELTVSAEGSADVTVTGLVIRETDQLWTMLLCIILFCCGILTAALIYPVYQKKYPVPRRIKGVFFCEALIVLCASIPYLRGDCLSGGDLIYHLMRIEGVKDAILSGQIPVRIEPEWVFGHGYANAVFYCDLFLVFPALLRILGFTVTAGYQLYFIALNLATAAISYYVFSRIFGDEKTGIVCSALYVLSVIRIHKSLIFCVLGEVTAYAFLPLVLYGFYRVFTENPEEKSYQTCWISLAFGFAGLVCSHVLTCEITVALTIALCALCIRKIFRKKVFWELCKGALAAIGLSLWQLVPFLDYYLTQDVHIRHVSGRTIQEAGLSPENLLFGLWKGIREISQSNNQFDFSSAGVSLILFLVWIVFLLFWLGRRLRERERTLALAKVSAVFAGVLLFMSLKQFPWNAIQTLHPVAATLVSSLQFPSRFLNWGTLFLVIVFGYVMQYCRRMPSRKYYGLCCVGAALSLAASTLYMSCLIPSRQSFLLYNEEGMGAGYISGGEYAIEGMEIEKMSYAAPAPSQGVEIISYRKDSLCIDLSCNAPEGGFIDLPLLLYKYYRVTAQSGPAPTLDYGENQVIRVWLPEGFAGSFTVRYVSPVSWRICEILSVLAVLMILAAWIKNRRKESV